MQHQLSDKTIEIAETIYKSNNPFFPSSTLLLQSLNVWISIKVSGKFYIETLTRRKFTILVALFIQ